MLAAVADASTAAGMPALLLAASAWQTAFRCGGLLYMPWPSSYTLEGAVSITQLQDRAGRWDDRRQTDMHEAQEHSLGGGGLGRRGGGRGAGVGASVAVAAAAAAARRAAVARAAAEAA